MTEDQALTRRERQAAERRERILDMAVHIFAQKGYHKTTTREIAEAADVGEGTIFNYFGTKSDLLLAIIDRLADTTEHRRLAEETLDMDYRKVLTWGIANRMKNLDEGFKMFLAVLPEVISIPELRERFYDHLMRPAIEIGEGHLRGRVKRGHVRGDLDVPLTVRLFRSMSLGLSLMAVLGDEVVEDALANPDRLAEAMTSLVLDGIGKEITAIDQEPTNGEDA